MAFSIAKEYTVNYGTNGTEKVKKYKESEGVAQLGWAAGPRFFRQSHEHYYYLLGADERVLARCGADATDD